MRKQAASLAVAPEPEPQPTAPSSYHAPRALDYARTYGEAGRAIHRAAQALESIEALADLLTCEELERGCDEPQLVLSSRQRVGLMQGVCLLAVFADSELLTAMEHGCKEDEVYIEEN